MPNLIIHTASLYYWFGDYETHLDDRIHAALDAGLDGVEISNGPSLITWKPAPETLERLRNCTVTIHAEIYHELGIDLDIFTQAMKRLSGTGIEIKNIVFHPDELKLDEIARLKDLPFPCSLENMDSLRSDWRYAQEIRQLMGPGVGFTFDTAHAEENGVSAAHFARLMTPAETHLSVPNEPGNFYLDWGFNTRHALTQFRPDDFPHIPGASPIVTIEGLVPPDMGILRDEIRLVKGRLD